LFLFFMKNFAQLLYIPTNHKTHNYDLKSQPLVRNKGSLWESASFEREASSAQWGIHFGSLVDALEAHPTGWA